MCQKLKQKTPKNNLSKRCAKKLKQKMCQKHNKRFVKNLNKLCEKKLKQEMCQKLKKEMC